MVWSMSSRFVAISKNPLLTILVAPAVQGFAKTYPHAVFAKVDVDAQQQLAQTYQISAM